MREVKALSTYVRNINIGSRVPGISGMIGVEHRTNNGKRDFLFVNRMQCKHIPCRPSMLFLLCNNLANQVYSKTQDKKVLVIGFAETATAIANIIAESLENCVFYMQTTREQVDNEAIKFHLAFTEEHSHAPDQYLVSDKSLDELRDIGFDYVLFVDDEITTGKTVLNCIDEFDYFFPDKEYGVASLCNWQSSENIAKFDEQGVDRFSLVTGEIIDTNKRMDLTPDDYTDCCTVPSITNDIAYHNPNRFDSITLELQKYKDERLSREINNETRVERKGIVEFIAKMATHKWGLAIPSNRYLVIGTEEFMSIPCYVCQELSDMGYNVRVQATTRSPISVINGSTEIMSEICNKAKIVGAYDKNRDTYLYNLRNYDGILVITDGAPYDVFYSGVLKSFEYFGVKPSDVTFVTLKRKIS